ncbi:MAG: hypothetical protein J6C90_00190 [Clostridia bacterium]|nr:hypothetical protein [Clostridia bacterium]
MKDSFGCGLVLGMLAGIVLLKACKPVEELADKAEKAVKDKIKSSK